MNTFSESVNSKSVRRVLSAALFSLACLVSTSALAGKPEASGGSERVPFTMIYKCLAGDYQPYVYFELQSEDVPVDTNFKIEFVSGFFTQMSDIDPMGQAYVLIGNVTSNVTSYFGTVPSVETHRAGVRLLSSAVAIDSATTPTIKALGFTLPPATSGFCVVQLHGYLESL